MPAVVGRALDENGAQRQLGTPELVTLVSREVLRADIPKRCVFLDRCVVAAGGTNAKSSQRLAVRTRFRDHPGKSLLVVAARNNEHMFASASDVERLRRAHGGASRQLAGE